MNGTLNSLKRAHCADKGDSDLMRLPDFKILTYHQFNTSQIKFRFGICSSNVNLNHSTGLGQNWPYWKLTIKKLSIIIVYALLIHFYDYKPCFLKAKFAYKDVTLKVPWAQTFVSQTLKVEDFTNYIYIFTLILVLLST